MALDIETFSSVSGGHSFFKAVGHPGAQPAARRLIRRLAGAGPVAVYDPLGLAQPFGEIHDLSGVDIRNVFVQDLDALGRRVLGRTTRPVTELPGTDAAAVLVVAFDAERLVDAIRHLLPEGAEAVSLDEMRLDPAMVTVPRDYLDPLNFATNFAFFRDAEGLHTRLVTANYWAGYGAEEVTLWCMLLDGDGSVLAEWRETVPEAAAGIVIDSAEVRRRFDLPEFAGQLFLHVVGAAGHSVVKYALDTYGEGALSCTHDANAWPADLYAGLPAPDRGEQVILWVQNSHPCPIPAGAVGLNLMGSDDVAWLDREIGPFASYPLDVAELLPDARWPDQIEVRAGKHFVRPRYEVRYDGRRRIAHVNVERTDLRPDPRIAEIGNLMGKGYLLPAPVLPPERWRSTALPTPMATCQQELPIALLVFDSEGREVARHAFGRLRRRSSVAVEIDDLLAANGALAGGFGHMELVYDLGEGGAADGWLHGIFRYRDRRSGRAAETSFGAHIFNTVLTYRDEPQSYASRPPGLSTRLFLRLGAPPLETICHLIYPASTPWHPRSATDLILHAGDGTEVARRRVEIPCGGSLFWRFGDMFEAAERARAGAAGYVLVRDRTCRLFGYHGLIDGDGGFSLDHMFGF